MAEFSLDQYRAEYEADTHKVEVEGINYDLPAKLPMLVVQRVERRDISGAIALLFGADAADEVAPLFSEEAMMAMLKELYGIDGPESSASPGRSKSTGAQSRPTSSPSTNATSQKQSSANTSEPASSST